MQIMIIPAAGRGSRLNADVPKLLFEINGRTLIEYVMERHRPYVDQFIVVIHPDMETSVRTRLSTAPVDFKLSYQVNATGMLDAILAAAPLIKSASPDVVSISWCDQVAISEQTAARLNEQLGELNIYGMVFPTVIRPQPYIHMARDEQGTIVGVLQRREGDDMPTSGENDCGLFAMTGPTYLEYLPRFAKHVSRGSTTTERNFLPFIPWLAARAPVSTFTIDDIHEAVGVNTQEDARLLSPQLQAS